jgi:hypothetical protein
MEDEIKIIKKLLMIKREYPFLALSVETNGLIYEFYLKKGFWNQVYGRFIVEVFYYKKSGAPFSGYRDLIQNKQKGSVTSLDCFSSEEESMCESEIQKFCFGLAKDGRIEIKENNLSIR